ncbi:hypothetical protein L2E82_05800 [Cichorium intybus]|uniref:Uncharacterized protein n=1 Tax=Cichorium intybus TaxID=13427 RepID=A0ACB9H7S7_CICIN|nr:hypothetical protein L2E82_05800 [Cichorium intybus]
MMLSKVLRRDIPWEIYLATKLITGTSLQLLRRYDKKTENEKAQLLDDEGPSYIHVFISILRDIQKEETVEYVLALIDEMLTANPKRAKLFHDKTLADEDISEPFLRLLWKGSWFRKEKSSKILTLIVSATPKQIDPIANGQSTDSKKKITTSDHVLKGLLEWLCIQLKKPSHPTRTIPALVNCLATLLKEPIVRSSFDNNDPSYIHLFLSILRYIQKEDMVEYVLALIYEILTASPKRAKLFYDKTLAYEDIYKPFMRLLWKGSWLIQEKSSKILTLIVSARPKQNGSTSNEQSTNSKKKMTTSDDVLKGLVEWLCIQLKEPSHPTRTIPASLNCLATLLTEPVVTSSFVRADGCSRAGNSAFV